MKKRIVITGLGVVSPIGIGVGEFWKAALAGDCGISAVPAFDSLPMEAYRSRVVGRVRNFHPATYLDSAQAERLDRYAQFGLVVAKEAITDAALRMDQEASYRVGVIVGAGMGAMTLGERELTKLYLELKPNRVPPNFIPAITMNSLSGLIALAHGAKGPNYTISTACSSSAHAIGQALVAIRTAQADVVIVVGADASITPLVLAGFGSLRALSTRYNDDPGRASRPFDRGRDGFVLGEGAGALILESLPHARKRRARLAPAQVDYVNAHATSTIRGDEVEIRGIRRLLKTRASKVVVSATKSMIGHTLGAAGSIGAVATTMAIQSGLVHPTINYEDPDPECQLSGIAAKPQERRI